MKFIKKCFSVLLVLLFICTSTAIIKADNNFVVYTKSDSDFDDYAKDHAFDFIDSHDLVLSSSDVTLATGIYVYSDDNSEEMIYPVLCNNNVVLTIEVFKEGDNIGGSSSYNFVDFFNSIKNNTSSTNPLVIHKTNGKLYASVDSTLYNMNGGLYTGPTSSTRITGIVSSVDSIKTIDMTQTRSGFGYCSWTVYPTLTYHGYLFCVPMSIYNIYKNMGYTDFADWNSFENDIHSFFGATTSTANLNYNQTISYLNYKNLQFSSSSSGNMTLSEIITMTNTNHRYGLAFSKDESRTYDSGDHPGHVTVIIGYSMTNYGNYVIMFDPHGSSTDQRITVELTTNIEYTSNNHVYTWNYGYAKDITK